MRRGVALVALTLAASCGFAREHPRTTLVSATTVIFAAGIGTPLSLDCDNATSTCSDRYIASVFGIGAAVGLGIGLVAVHELEVGKPPAEPRARTPWPEELRPAPRRPIVPDPPRPALPKIESIPWGNASTEKDWMSSGSGPTPMIACAAAKQILLRELEELCADSGFPGIETHDLDSRDCTCMGGPTHAECATRALVTCAKDGGDIVGTGVAVSDSRTVAEDLATDLAKARCTLEQLVPAPVTITCRCDVDTGECACVARTACD